MVGRGQGRHISVLGLGLAVGIASVAGQTAPQPSTRVPVPRVSETAVTSGAASGYLADEVCGRCHARIAREYRQLGMARSFAPPGENGWVEDFDSGAFHHRASDQYFQLSRRDGQLVFRRHQKDAAGAEINVLELPVDWVLGSGSVSRSYLYQTPSGEVYQLPIAWYAGSGWAMAPGFDRPDHDGVSRPVRRECLFCHNAYPEVPAGSDRHFAPQSFPFELPHGIGCQRCHGPGSQHVAAVSAGASPIEVAARIVNPRTLSTTLRRAVCDQCHYQPSVAMFGLRRFDRGDYSFVPGQDLDAYQVQLEIAQEGHAPADRFEINHHAYRLRQSRCATPDGEPLECTACHDPHRKPPRLARLARVRQACVKCHAAEPGVAAGHLDQDNCAGCHMPRRRAQDVVHAVVTDHRIRREPAPAEWREPRAESDPVVSGVSALTAVSPVELEQLYRMVAVVRAGSRRLAGDLAQLVERVQPLETIPWLDLAQAQLSARDWAATKATVDRLLARDPRDPLARHRLAIAEWRLGRLDRSRSLLETLVAERPEWPEPRFNLALLRLETGDPASALEELRRVIVLRPTMVSAWVYLGRTLAILGRPAEAADAFRRALEVEPRSTDAYVGIVRALAASGRAEEAKRFLDHGLVTAARPGLLESLQ